MKTHILKRETLINKNISEVFDFFSKAGNLNRLTPEQLGFEILSELPVDMKVGTIIDYKIKLNFIPFKWQSLITKWDPPFLFEDTQVKGPYRIWVHEHKFEDKGDSTLMTDTVNYLSPGSIFEFIPHYLIVKKKVESIFDYREKILANIFSE